MHVGGGECHTPAGRAAADILAQVSDGRPCAPRAEHSCAELDSRYNSVASLPSMEVYKAVDGSEKDGPPRLREARPGRGALWEASESANCRN